jgi:hypothetical protein
MPRFEIFSNPSLIGWSELELGDAPMGVAFGRLLPAPGYLDVKAVVVAAQGGPLSEDLELSIRDGSGTTLESSGGVHIADQSAELGPEGLEVSVLGIPYPNYGTVFPEHVAAYERQFKNGAISEELYKT